MGGKLLLIINTKVSIRELQNLASRAPAINIRGERYLQPVAKDSGIDIGPPHAIKTAAMGPAEHFFQCSVPIFQKNPLPLPLSGALCENQSRSGIDESDVSNGWFSPWSVASKFGEGLALGGSGVSIAEFRKIAMVTPLDNSGRHKPSRDEGKSAVGRHIWARAGQGIWIRSRRVFSDTRDGDWGWLFR